MARNKEKEGKKGFFSKLFKKQEEAAMEEEITGEVKKIEPKVLEDIDMGRKSPLDNVDPELRLWLGDGRVIKNLPELAAALKKMKPAVFKAHVSRNKNDFSDWIADIIKDNELATAVKKLKSPKAVYEELKKFEKTTKKEEKAAIVQKIKMKKEKARKQAKTTMEQLMPAPLKQGKNLTLTQREKILLEKEKQLNEEERRLNEKRIQLSKRRIALIKERGELEKERFENFLKQKAKTGYEELPFEEEPEPVREIKNKGELISLMNRIKQLIKEGNLEAAKRALEELQATLRATYMSEEEKRRLEYELLEIEADIKLASL